MATEEHPAEKPEEKPAEKPVVIDERAVRLAALESNAITASAQAECDIASSETLLVYVRAGRAHLDSIKCGKASLDHSCGVRGVATTWTAAYYDTIIDTITTRVRAISPESFGNFDALKEKAPDPAREREQLQRRILVALVADALAVLIGERVWDLPYRLVVNYLTVESIFQFSKADVSGSLREGNVEFLKTQLSMVADKKSSTASFLNALKAHYAEVDKAAQEKADAHLTPEQRTVRDAGNRAQAEAKSKEEKISKVKENLAGYLAKAMTKSLIAPDEIAKMITTAAKKAEIILPIGKINPVTITVSELSVFLQMVIDKGGRSLEERKKLRDTIRRHGSELHDRAQQHKAKKAAELELAEAVA